MGLYSTLDYTLLHGDRVTEAFQINRCPSHLLSAIGFCNLLTTTNATL